MTRISYAEKVIEQLGFVFIALQSSPHGIRAAYSISHTSKLRHSMNEQTKKHLHLDFCISSSFQSTPDHVQRAKIHFSTPVHISVPPCRFFPHARRPSLSVPAAPDAWSSMALLDYGERCSCLILPERLSAFTVPCLFMCRLLRFTFNVSNNLPAPLQRFSSSWQASSPGLFGHVPSLPKISDH